LRLHPKSNRRVLSTLPLYTSTSLLQSGAPANMHPCLPSSVMLLPSALFFPAFSNPTTPISHRYLSPSFLFRSWGCRDLRLQPSAFLLPFFLLQVGLFPLPFPCGLPKAFLGHRRAGTCILPHGDRKVYPVLGCGIDGPIGSRSGLEYKCCAGIGRNGLQGVEVFCSGRRIYFVVSEWEAKGLLNPEVP